jgi:hypothetical protein
MFMLGDALTQADSSFSLLSLGFNKRFMTNKMAMEQVFFKFLQFSAAKHHFTASLYPSITTL